MGLFDFIRGSKNVSLDNVPDEMIRIEAAKRGEAVSKMLTETATSMRQQTMQDWKSAISAARAVENPNRTKLYELIESLLLDPHLASIMESRVLPVLRSKFAIYDNQTGDEDPELKSLFETEWFEKYMRYFMLTRFWGTTVVELFEMNEEGKLADIKMMPRRHVKPEKGIIVKDPGDESGWHYKEPPLSNYYIQIGDDKDLGMLVELAPMVIAKKYAITAWCEYVEKYGIPPRWVKSSSMSPKRQEQLAKMMRNMISSAWAVLEGDETIESLKVPNTDAHKVFDQLIARINSEMSKRILGQDGTTDNKDASGTYGSLKVLQGVAMDRHMSDKAAFKYHVNGVLIPFLIDRGYPLQGKQFDWDEFNELSPSELIKAVKDLSVNFEIDPDYITEKTGIPIIGARRNPGPVPPEPDPKKKV